LINANAIRMIHSYQDRLEHSQPIKKRTGPVYEKCTRMY